MSEYVKRRIAIISRDSRKSSFFELEGGFCDCDVTVFVEPPEELLGFDLVIADVEAGICVSSDPNCTVICLLSDDGEHEKAFGDRMWHWPVSIAEIHKVLVELYQKDLVPQKKENATTERCIYLLSEAEHTVLYRNRSILLSDSLWRLLDFLGARSGEVVDREELKQLFGGEGNLVEVYIHGLRKKLEVPFGIRLIETVRGKGYRLNAKIRHGIS